MVISLVPYQDSRANVASGGGNFHASNGGERGRTASGTDKGGVFGNVMRSLSRATGRDKSSDRPRD